MIKAIQAVIMECEECGWQWIRKTEEMPKRCPNRKCRKLHQRKNGESHKIRRTEREALVSPDPGGVGQDSESGVICRRCGGSTVVGAYYCRECELEVG